MTLDDFLSRLTHVKRTGAGYTARCPAHDDTSPSLWVKEGENGKIGFECKAGHCSGDQVLAAMELTWADIYPDSSPGPAAAGKPQIVAVYQYFTADGAYTYEVCRFEPGFKPGKKKDFRPRVKLADGHYRWGLAKGRYVQQHNGDWRAAKDSDDSAKTRDFDNVKMVLYRLPELVAAIAAKRRVFVVEGEKDADNLAKLGFAVTTNTGGAKKWLAGYSTLLSSARSVVILPDNDPPDKQGVRVGLEHAKQIHTQLPRSVIVELPGLPPKGDVSDWIAAGGSREALIELATQAMAKRDAAPPPLPPPVTDAPPQIDPDAPFKVLGFDDGRYFFLSRAARQIIPLSASDMAKKTRFLELAPLNYWEANYPSKLGADYSAAADDLITQCRATGLFERDRLSRGRGAWEDEWRIVLHQGDQLVVDGVATPLLGIKTRYVYEYSPRISVTNAPPLPVTDAQRLVALCTKPRWENIVTGPLFAGWIAVAPVCGVLDWRPHGWITGKKGTGKTWIVENIVSPLLGPLAIQVQASTSEAGVRQEVGSDARPVIFDESEAHGERGKQNMQKVLELARSSSSHSKARIVKGTPGGKSQSWHVQSMFLFSSIGVSLRLSADISRVTVFSLSDATGDTDSDKTFFRDHFKALQAEAAALCTSDYSAGLIARSCGLARVIKSNAATFSDAIAETFPKRAGDQLGALMAGYWSLRSDATISLAEAREEVQQWPLELLVATEDTGDETQCLSHLLTQPIRFDKPSYGVVEWSIGEVLDAARGLGETTVATQQAAEICLRRHGIRTEGDWMMVANNHSRIGKLFTDTEWETDYPRILKRVPGAKSGEKVVKFPGGIHSRVVLVPLDSRLQKHEMGGPFPWEKMDENDATDLF